MVSCQKQEAKVQSGAGAFTGATINRYPQHLTVQNGPNSIIETTDEYLKPGQKLLKLEQRPEVLGAGSSCSQTVLLMVSRAEEEPGSMKL